MSANANPSSGLLTAIQHCGHNQLHHHSAGYTRLRIAARRLAAWGGSGRRAQRAPTATRGGAGGSAHIATMNTLISDLGGAGTQLTVTLGAGGTVSAVRDNRRHGRRSKAVRAGT